MKLKLFSKLDLKFYLKQHRMIYFMFLLCFFLGVVVGFVIMFSSDNFLKLLTSENKSLYPFINGTAETGVLFWKKLIKFVLPLLLIFGLGINYYTSLLSYIFITYQSSLLVLSCGAIIKTYGVAGFLNVMFVTLPINLLYFAMVIIFSETCFSRAKLSLIQKNFKEGYTGEFYLRLLIVLILVLLLVVFACLIYPLFLKNSIFMIF